MCITVKRHGTCFEMVGHVQQSVSVRRMTKHTLTKLGEVSNTSVNGEDMVVTQDGHALSLLASCCSSLELIDLATDFMGSGCILAVCLRSCFRASLLALLAILMSQQ